MNDNSNTSMFSDSVWESLHEKTETVEPMPFFYIRLGLRYFKTMIPPKFTGEKARVITELRRVSGCRYRSVQEAAEIANIIKRHIDPTTPIAVVWTGGEYVIRD